MASSQGRKRLTRAELDAMPVEELLAYSPERLSGKLPYESFPVHALIQTIRVRVRYLDLSQYLSANPTNESSTRSTNQCQQRSTLIPRDLAPCTHTHIVHRRLDLLLHGRGAHLAGVPGYRLAASVAAQVGSSCAIPAGERPHCLLVSRHSLTRSIYCS